MELYQLSIDGFGGIKWPDGRPPIQQPVRLIAAFRIFAWIKDRYTKKKGE